MNPTNKRRFIQLAVNCFSVTFAKCSCRTKTWNKLINRWVKQTKSNERQTKCIRCTNCLTSASHFKAIGSKLKQQSFNHHYLRALKQCNQNSDKTNWNNFIRSSFQIVYHLNVSIKINDLKSFESILRSVYFANFNLKFSNSFNSARFIQRFQYKAHWESLQNTLIWKWWLIVK